MAEIPARRTHPLMLAAPLVLAALVAVTVGIIAGHTTAIQAGIACTQTSIYVATCTQTPFFHLFFSDPLHFKVWLATGAFALGVLQVLSAARIYGRMRLPGTDHLWQGLHRWTGRVAILLTLPVAYHCIFLLGFQTFSTRVFLHSIFGSAFYGIFLGKVWIVRARGFPGWALPVAGGLLFAVLLGLWWTSALWIFTRFGIAL
jgi:uncharacterized membrane-anchored protein YitT (DUF2179 family)